MYLGVANAAGETGQPVKDAQAWSMIPYQPETHLSTIARDTVLHVSGPDGETGQPVKDAEAWSMITFHTKTHLSTIARAKLLVHDSLDTQHSSPYLSRQRTTITKIPNAGDIGILWDLLGGRRVIRTCVRFLVFQLRIE
jgi:hypothetical protein